MKGWLKKRLQSLNLLPDYFRSAYQQSHEVLWGASIPSVIFFVWWSIGLPPKEAVIWWFLSVFFFAGYHVWRADHVRLVPQLEISATRLEGTPVTDGQHVISHRIFAQLVPKCLTESPVYECTGHLTQVRRWSTDNDWEITDLGSLVLCWGNSAERTITLYPNAEKFLNIFRIGDNNYQVFPCVQADTDIPEERFVQTFLKRSEGAEAYQLDIQIDCSARINGQLESIKPAKVCLEVRLGENRLKPELKLLDDQESTQQGWRISRKLLLVSSAIVLILATFAIFKYRHSQIVSNSVPDNRPVAVPEPKSNAPATNEQSPTINHKPARKNTGSPESRPFPQPNNSSVVTQSPSSAPQTWLDRMVDRNKHLTEGDRNRLSDALFDFAKFLDEGNELWGKANQEGAQFRHAWQDGTIATTSAVHRKTLREIASDSKDYEKRFWKLRDKWSYFQAHIDFVFGDNPDNLGPNQITNATEGLANYLDSWATIQNKQEQSTLNLLGNAQNDYDERTVGFQHWRQACVQRVEQMKESIR